MSVMKLKKSTVVTGVVVGAAIVALTVGGVTAAVAGGDRAGATEEVRLSSGAGEPAAAAPAEVTAEQAREIALGEVAGTVVEVERSTTDGIPVWSVYVQASDGSVRDVDVARADGRVVEIDLDRGPSAPAPTSQPTSTPEPALAPPAPAPTTAAPAAGAGEISSARAQEIAVAAVPGTVIEVERDTEYGVPVWSVYVRSGDGTVRDVNVARADGRIVDIDIEHDDDYWD